MRKISQFFKSIFLEKPSIINRPLPVYYASPNLKILLSQIVHFFQSECSIERIAVYILEETRKVLALKETYGFDSNMELPETLLLQGPVILSLKNIMGAVEINWLQKTIKKEPVIIFNQNNEMHSLLNFMKYLSAELILPTFLKWRVKGWKDINGKKKRCWLYESEVSSLFVLGGKTNGKPYSTKEVDFLNEFAMKKLHQEIHHARLFEKSESYISYLKEVQTPKIV